MIHMQKKEPLDSSLNVFTDVCAWLEKEFPTEEAMNKYAQSLEALDKATRAATNEDGANDPNLWIETPPPPDDDGLSVMVGLWQLGFYSASAIKGPSPTSDVVDCLEKIMTSKTGNETKLYPLQVLYGLCGPPASPGAPVVPFSVGLNVGFTVTLACHIFARYVLHAYQECEWNNAEFWLREDQIAVAIQLRKCLRMEGRYAPQISVDKQVFSSISAKKQAGMRQPPNLIQLLFAFNRLITAEQSAGSRKTPMELLSGYIAKHNQSEKVHKAKLTTDEIKGLKTIMRMGPEFRKVLAQVWGTDKCCCTAVTMEMIGSPFLDPTLQPAASKKSNPLWYDILTPNDAKFTAWLKRTAFKFDASVAAAETSGKVVNLRNQAHLHRDKNDDSALLWRMACLWVACENQLKKNLGPERFAELQKMFFLGMLDNDMRDYVAAMDATFLIDDVRFVKASDAHIGVEGELDDKERAAKAQEVEATLNTWQIQLGREAVRFKEFCAKLKAFETKKQADYKALVELRHRLLTDTVQQEMGARYQLAGFQSMPSCRNFMQASLQKVAAGDAPVAEDNILRVNLLDLGKYGPHHSILENDFIEMITTELHEHPVTSCVFVFPPHHARSGVSMSADRNPSDEDVAAACSEMIGLFCKQCKNVQIRRCVIMYESSTLSYWPNRALLLDFYVVLSDQTEADGVTQKSLWTKSALWIKRGVPTLVHAHPRSAFRDWTSKVDTGDKSLLGVQERMLWNSGRSLYADLLQAAFSGMRLTRQDRCFFLDWSLFDDEAGKATMDLRVKASPDQPSVYYAGVVQTETKTRADTIVGEVSSTLKGDLYEMVSHQIYLIQGFRPSKEPTASDDGKPTLDENSCKITAVRANNALPIRSTELEKLANLIKHVDGKAELTLRLEAIVAAHNKEMNPTGEPFKAPAKKRPIDEVSPTGSGGPEVQAISIEPKVGDYKTVDDMKAAGVVHIVAGAEPFYEYFFPDDASSMYIHVLDDGIISPTVKLASVKGKYKMGDAAQTLMREGTNYVEFKLADQTSLLACSVSGDLPKQIVSSPIPLKEIVEFLEAAGKVQTEILGHKLTPSEGSDGTLAVICEEQIAMEVPEGKPEGSKLARTNIAGLLDVAKVQESSHVQFVINVTYIVKLNKIKPWYPGLYFKQAIRVKKGDFIKVVP